MTMAISSENDYEGVFTYVDDDGNEKRLYPEIKTDTSLHISGKAADAAAVGNKLSDMKNNIGTYDMTPIIILEGSTTVTIKNSNIKKSSLIDIYYAENSKETVANAGATYSQAAGSLTITFKSALEDDISIAAIRIVNPVDDSIEVVG